MPILLLKYWKYIAAVLLVIAVVVWFNAKLHNAKQEGISEANAACSVSKVQEAEAARNLVDRVKAEAKAQAEKDKADRDRQSKEDDERRSREQAERDSKMADLRSLMHKSSPDCKQWRSELYRCATQ